MASQSPNSSGELLALRNITLDYGEFRALNRIHFNLAPSEIHAIVGEHGAGKSSLGMLISGILKPQSGQILFDGHTYRTLTLKTASKIGIEMVHQHSLSLNQYFSVAENLSLPNMPLFTGRKKNIHAVQSFFSHYDVTLDPSVLVEQLNASDQVFVEILKHVYPQPKLLILDETLEKLTAPAFNKIVHILTLLKREGASILLITHRIDDIYNLADRVSIIKNGEILLTDEVKNIDKLNLIKMAYIQISTEQHINHLNTEFYQFLKYNEAILRNLPVNLIVADNERRIKMVNNYCKQYFHLQEHLYFNVPLEQFFSGNNAGTLALLNTAFSSEQEKAFYQIPLVINTLQTVNNIKTFPIYDGTFLLGHIIIIEDITEYDQLQKQVMLSEKLASVGLLAAGVAHEINNPLEIIYNSLDFLKYHIHSKPLEEAVDDIQEEMSSIANIVSNLHSFSDQKQSMNEEIDVNEAIRSILNLIQYNAKYRHITIRFEPYKHEICIRANKSEMKQVILNLLKNSFEAMPSGGDIFIKTMLMTKNGSDFVQLTFQDTGTGICDKNPNNVFLPFYSTKKGQESNFGLGLSVSYGIIKKYNGTISVENIENSGCQFIIHIPQSGKR